MGVSEEDISVYGRTSKADKEKVLVSLLDKAGVLHPEVWKGGAAGGKGGTTVAGEMALFVEKNIEFVAAVDRFVTTMSNLHGLKPSGGSSSGSSSQSPDSWQFILVPGATPTPSG